MSKATALTLIYFSMSCAIGIACWVTSSGWPLLAFTFAPGSGAQYD